MLILPRAVFSDFELWRHHAFVTSSEREVLHCNVILGPTCENDVYGVYMIMTDNLLYPLLGKPNEF